MPKGISNCPDIRTKVHGDLSESHPLTTHFFLDEVAVLFLNGECKSDISKLESLFSGFKT